MIILNLRLTGPIFSECTWTTKHKIIWVASQKIEGKIPTKTYPMQIISALFGALGISVEAGKITMCAAWALILIFQGMGRNFEVEALIKACSPHLKPIVEVALLTGMRRGELLGLKWDQIRNGFIYLTETKSGKDRQIPINDRLAKVLRELRQRMQLKSPLVFCDSQGRRFHEVKRSFASACRKAGIEGFRFHDLRHTFASHLVMNGVGLKAVQELLGHADIKMTMRYSHLSQAHLKEAVAVLNQMGIDTNLTQKPCQSKKADNPTIANLL